MADEEEFVDFATVRDLLISAQERRGQLTYEQTAALQHAEWAASDNRNGYKTNPEVFKQLVAAIEEIEIFGKHKDLAAKLGELMPMSESEIRAVAASKRIAIDSSDVEQVLTLVRQHIGFE